MMKFWRCLSGYNAAIEACTVVTEKVAEFNSILGAHKNLPNTDVDAIKQRAQKVLGCCPHIPRK